MDQAGQQIGIGMTVYGSDREEIGTVSRVWPGQAAGSANAAENSGSEMEMSGLIGALGDESRVGGPSTAGGSGALGTESRVGGPSTGGGSGAVGDESRVGGPSTGGGAGAFGDESRVGGPSVGGGAGALGDESRVGGPSTGGGSGVLGNEALVERASGGTFERGTESDIDLVEVDTVVAEPVPGGIVAAGEEDLYAIPATGTADGYLEVDSEGVLGFGGRRLYIPFAAVQSVPNSNSIQLNVSKDQAAQMFSQQPDDLT